MRPSRLTARSSPVRIPARGDGRVSSNGIGVRPERSQSRTVLLRSLARPLRRLLLLRMNYIQWVSADVSRPAAPLFLSNSGRSLAPCSAVQQFWLFDLFLYLLILQASLYSGPPPLSGRCKVSDAPQMKASMPLSLCASDNQPNVDIGKWPCVGHAERRRVILAGKDALMMFAQFALDRSFIPQIWSL